MDSPRTSWMKGYHPKGSNSLWDVFLHLLDSGTWKLILASKEKALPYIWKHTGSGDNTLFVVALGSLVVYWLMC